MSPKSTNKVGSTKKTTNYAESPRSDLERVWHKYKDTAWNPIKGKIGIKQEDISKIMGFTQSNFNQLLSGSVKLSIDRGVRFAEILKCPIEEFGQEFAERAHHLWLNEKIVPILDLDFAVDWLVRGKPPLTPEDYCGNISSFGSCGPSAFAIKVPNNLNSNIVSRGDKVLVDPDVENSPGTLNLYYWERPKSYTDASKALIGRVAAITPKDFTMDFMNGVANEKTKTFPGTIKYCGAITRRLGGDITINEDL
jgi:transcriptional regulator with XRE-family HTH domain